MKKNSLSIFMVLMLVLAIGLGGCAKGSGDGPLPQSRLVYGSGDYTVINPALYEHGEINLLLFTGLTRHDGNNQVVADLATDWSYDEKTCTYTFRLRQDVKWHDGQPFTARDVRFTLEAIMDPENASENASNFEDITQIETPDDYTVAITLCAPNVALLDYLTIGILPAHLLEGKDLATDDFNRNPIGTGPYKLEKWAVGQSITLVRNQDFYRGVPRIETVVFKIVQDSKARALQLKSGKLDLAQVTPEDADSFRTKGYTVYDMKTADYRGILYNFNSDFFKANRELPTILCYAIDRQAIVDTVLKGCGQAAYSPLQAGPYNNPDIEKFTYDPEKCARLLDEAGWKMGPDGVREKNGQKLAFVLHNGQGDQVRIDMSTIVSQQLKAVGADVKVSVDALVDWAGQEAYLIGWGSPFDPDDHTYKVFGTGKGANYSAYSNARIDELLTRARQTDDIAERKQLYGQFQQEMTKDMPYTFIAYVDAIYVTKPGLSGIKADTVLGHHGVGIFWNVAEWTIE
nr:ABC transporter substrate-binding protein [bacterium]